MEIRLDEIESWEYDNNVPFVYDLSIDGNTNYFIEDNFLVHNSGKTYGTLAALAIYLAECEIKEDWLVVGQASTEMETGAYKDWLDIMDKMPIGVMVNKTTRKWKVGKSFIIFKTIDTIGKAKSGKRSGVFINECNHQSWEIAEQLIIKSKKVIIDWNPTAKFWWHKKVKPNLADYIPYHTTRTTYHDNKALDEDTKRRIENMWKDDPYKYAVYVLGMDGKREGLIIPEYQTFRDWPEYGKSRGYFLDFGFTNDVTALGEAKIVGDAIYSKEIIYKTGLLTRDLNDLMLKVGVDKRIPIYCDNIPKEVAELSVYGWILIKTKKFAGSVNHGINVLKQYKHFVHETSLNAMEEMDNYEWVKKDGEFIEVPIDKFNHYIDGLRYYAVANAGLAVTQSSQRVYGQRLV